MLFQHLKTLFPSRQIEMNYTFTDRSIINRSMQFDVFIPEFALAIEYNGEYHYVAIPVYDHASSVQKRDEVKKMVCSEAGISLIIIPFWWDNTIESVAQSIHALRPDIEIPKKWLTGKSITQLPPKLQPAKGMYISLLFQ